MKKVQKFELTEEALLESAERRFQNGDWQGALTMLNKFTENFGQSADSLALYADIYEELELWQSAADAWFRFLDVCNEADFGEGYEGLAVAFMNMGNELQSAIYYHRAYTENGELSPDLMAELSDLSEKDEEEKPRLRFVEDDCEEESRRLIAEGVEALKEGNVEQARKTLLGVLPESREYPSAAGLAAMCTLMAGEEEKAEKECEEILEKHPDNVEVLTTYCAVLGAREKHAEAKKVAARLGELPVERTEDLYRVATALCETGLDGQAYEKLRLLRPRMPYDESILYLYAAAAYRSGHLEEGIEALEFLTTLYPRKAVAKYYLERMRAQRDGDGKEFPMNYFYRMPEDEYREIGDFFLAAAAMDARDAQRLGELPQLIGFFDLAFDELEGRDEKLQLLAVRVADHTRSDEFLRDQLLNCRGNEFIKMDILHTLTVRNEDDVFGVVICNLYKEFETREISIGTRKRGAFLNAFADVYAKYAVLSNECADKIAQAAEDIYATLEDYGALSYCDERASLAAAIYRESRIPHGERKIEEIVKMFEADQRITQRILDYMM